MNPRTTSPANMDDYIAGFPAETQKILQKIRSEILKAVPKAGERISYRIPTFTLNGRYLLYFAAYKKHIGVYPVPAGDAQFDQEIAPYRKGPGTLQFPLDRPIPYSLIARAARLRAREHREKAAAKAGKQAPPGRR